MHRAASATSCLTPGMDSSSADNSFIVSLSQVHSVPLGGATPLLDVLMKAALAIKSNGPSHLFSLTAHISLGLLRDGEEQAICGARCEIISATFGGITAQFIGRCSALLISSGACLPQYTLVSKQ